MRGRFAPRRRGCSPDGWSSRLVTCILLLLFIVVRQFRPDCSTTGSMPTILRTRRHDGLPVDHNPVTGRTLHQQARGQDGVT